MPSFVFKGSNRVIRHLGRVLRGSTSGPGETLCPPTRRPKSQTRQRRLDDDSDAFVGIVAACSDDSRSEQTGRSIHGSGPPERHLALGEFARSSIMQRPSVASTRSGGAWRWIRSDRSPEIPKSSRTRSGDGLQRGLLPRTRVGQTRTPASPLRTRPGPHRQPRQTVLALVSRELTGSTWLSTPRGAACNGSRRIEPGTQPR